MCPDAVLSEDQKKVRFQRMIRKREAALTLFSDNIRGNFNTSDNSLKWTVGEPLNFSPPGKFARLDFGSNLGVKLPFATPPPPSTGMKTSPTILGTTAPKMDVQNSAKKPSQGISSLGPQLKPTIPVQWPKTLDRKVDEILGLYTLAMEKFGLEGFIHQHKFVPQHIAKFSEAFCDFANSCRFQFFNFLSKKAFKSSLCLKTHQ